MIVTAHPSEAGTPESRPSGGGSVSEARRSRPHLHELDLIRVITALGVVGVHVAYYTAFLNSSPAGVTIQHGIESSLHFTREVFMFTTAFVLVYAYAGKPFATKSFWRKRGIGVVLPYAAWSAIYIWLADPGQSPAHFATTSLLDILSGNASYQLYYILLTIQFYVLFPLFLRVLPALDRHRWKVLAVSAVLELALMAVDYATVQTNPLRSTALGAFVAGAQDRVVLIYQFYFVLGAIAALHLDALRAWVLRHGALLMAGFALVFAAFWTHYLVAIGPWGQPISYAISVLQPMMVIYSVAVLGFLGWLASRWAARRKPNGEPHGARIWWTLADASFGIYLIHPLFLTAALAHLAPLLPAAWPVAPRVVVIWCVVAGATVLLSVTLLRTPVLSRLVGRSTALPRPSRVWRETGAGYNHLASALTKGHWRARQPTTPAAPAGVGLVFRRAGGTRRDATAEPEQPVVVEQQR